MGSEPSPYRRFQNALASGNLLLVRAAAADLPTVELGDALSVCVLLSRKEPERYERAAMRWLGRFCLEASRATLQDVRSASLALTHLRQEPDDAMKILHDLCARCL